jgi:ribosomal protein S3AE
VSEHSEESIANKVETCKFVRFAVKLVSDTVKQELQNNAETG